jgi:hypothetical protein
MDEDEIMAGEQALIVDVNEEGIAYCVSFNVGQLNEDRSK